jgi:S-adenosylmethionine-diacylgycerolhomoserine-N-methlytransferase
MDKVYRRQRFFYDLTRKYYLLGRDRAIRELELAPGARLVEVGCGTARNLVRIARQYPGTELFGLDASAEMLRTATRAIGRAGLGARVVLAPGYAEALSPALFGETKPFDAALFSYSLSMMPDWEQALRAADSALAPGGRVHIVDFGDLAGVGKGAERVLRAWLALFHVFPRSELLHRFESEPRSDKTGQLHVLPGRYSFVLTLGKSTA